MRFLLMLVLVWQGLTTSVQARDFGMTPDAIVLTFNMSGGQKPRTGEAPILAIAADGTITARATRPGDPPVISHLDEAARNALFQELIDDDAALAITTKAIEAEVADSGLRLRTVPGAPTTSLTVDLPEGHTAVTLKGVSAMARQLPEAATLHRLFRIQTRLLDIAAGLTKPAP
ncbi:hypothetical protein EOK75_09640 [Pseudorhodobacter turbinis]|uniref:Uncharacterized protein n=1 Tax=Pseudorhodobacter turbinis TaxID=2500533 RepID=A0A4P8EGP5_9RHOB|nr:hypothetical protein [Pseudorhodobacter turbinis]QCO55979.1 hypothetical protein EOK75_09640 [Pseudorhodobacter turbinis]